MSRSLPLHVACVRWAGLIAVATSTLRPTAQRRCGFAGAAASRPPARREPGYNFRVAIPDGDNRSTPAGAPPALEGRVRTGQDALQFLRELQHQGLLSDAIDCNVVRRVQLQRGHQREREGPQASYRMRCSSCESCNTEASCQTRSTTARPSTRVVAGDATPRPPVRRVQLQRGHQREREGPQASQT